MIAKIVAKPFLVILMATIFCHGLLPFTDYVIWDDLWMMNWLQHGNFDWISDLWHETGRVPEGYFLFPFAYAGDIVLTSKILGFVAAFTTGCLAYSVAWKSGLLDSSDCLLIALVSVCLPAYKLLGGCIYMIYVVPPILLLLGVFAALHLQDFTGWRHFALRILAIVLFLVSFVMNSTLTFFGGFFLLMIHVRQCQLDMPWYRIPWAYLIRMSDFIFLPFLYWTYKRTFHQPYGHYANYNHPEVRLDWIVDGYKSLPDILTDPLLLANSFPFRFKVLIVILFLLLIPVLYYVFKSQARDEPTTSVRPRYGLFIVVFGSILLFFATIPYVLVGRTFGTWSLNTTYNALIPIPVGILAVGLYHLLGRATARAAIVRAVVLSAALAVWAPAWWHNYLSLQAVQVRNTAIFRQYHNDPMSDGVSFVRVGIDFPIDRTPDYLIHWVWTYRDCGVAGTPRSIALNETLLGLPAAEKAPIPEAEAWRYFDATTISTALSTIDLKGREMQVFIKRGPGYRRPIQCASRYLYLKYFHPQELDSFLQDQVRVSIIYPKVNP